MEFSAHRLARSVRASLTIEWSLLEHSETPAVAPRGARPSGVTRAVAGGWVETVRFLRSPVPPAETPRRVPDPLHNGASSAYLEGGLVRFVGDPLNQGLRAGLKKRGKSCLATGYLSASGISWRLASSSLPSSHPPPRGPTTQARQSRPSPRPQRQTRPQSTLLLPRRAQILFR